MLTRRDCISTALPGGAFREDDFLQVAPLSGRRKRADGRGIRGDVGADRCFVPGFRPQNRHERQDDVPDDRTLAYGQLGRKEMRGVAHDDIAEVTSS